MSIYEILDVYNTLFETTERLGKQYFGENYEQYVGGMLSSYSEQINEINTAIDENREIFDTYVEGLLLYDETYSEVYGKVLAAQKEYQDALLGGDEEAAAAAVLTDIHPRDSWRASKAFRKHIAVELAKRCLTEAVKLAGGAF